MSAPASPGPLVTATASRSSQAHPGLGERRFDRRLQLLQVRARGDLGHDSAVTGVLGHAGGDRVGQQRAAADDPDPGLVAAGLDAEHEGLVGHRILPRLQDDCHSQDGSGRIILRNDNRPGFVRRDSDIAPADARTAPPAGTRSSRMMTRRRRRAGSSRHGGRSRRSPPTRTGPPRRGCRRAPRGTPRVLRARRPRRAAPAAASCPARIRDARVERDGLDVAVGGSGSARTPPYPTMRSPAPDGSTSTT